MRLATVDKLFKENNPTGCVVRNYRRGSNWYTIWFTHDGKGYDYYATSVYSLAERLELIPEVDVGTLAREIVTELAAGKPFILAVAGCGDTCQYLYHKDGNNPNYYIDEGYPTDEQPTVDEFGRALSRYMLAYDDGAWSCTTT